MTTLQLAPVRATSPRVVRAVLGLGTFLLYLLTASYTVQSIDTVSTYIPAWQLAHHGTLSVDRFADPDLWFVHAHGRLVSNRFPGAILLATPFYLLLDHSSAPLPLVANLTAAVATAGAVCALHALLHRVADGRTALLGALLMAVGTPTWEVSGSALWTHGPAQLWLLLGLLAVAHERLLLAGPAFGAAVLTRPHLAVVPAVLGAAVAVRARSSRPALQLGLGSAAGVLGLLLYDRVLYGGWTLGGDYGSRLAGGGSSTAQLHLGGVGPRAFVVGLFGTLVSPARGVLVLSPFLVLLLPGLPAAWRAGPPWARAAALGGLVYLACQLWLDEFSGGYGFPGYRVPLEPLTLTAPLLALSHAAWTARRRWRRRAFVLAAAVSVAVQALGAVGPSDSPGRPDVWTHLEPFAVLRAHAPLWAVVPLASAALVLVVARRSGALRASA